MDVPEGFMGYLWNLIAFFPIFMLLLLLGIIKAVLVGPIVMLEIVFGNSVTILGLWPFHLVWSVYCIIKTKKFGVLMKILLVLNLPIPLLIWPPLGFILSVLVGLGYGFYWPLLETFEAVGEGVENKFSRCFTNGTWNSILGGCTIVRDFADVCFHSYFSVMDELLESEREKLIELKLSQLPGCILVGIIGVLVDVPTITVMVIYKTPIMLLKGWKRLLGDLIGRSGPFLETVCVPFAGLSILLWPIVVGLSATAGISSSVILGLYASFVAYQENSSKRGLLYIVAILSSFDEYTNDLLYLREGSCFPKPRYRKADDVDLSVLPVKRSPEDPEVARSKQHLVRTPSMKMHELKAVRIWDNFFKACEHTGKGLLEVGAIGVQDMEAWQHGKNNTINIGVPAYTFLQCFIRSNKSGCSGFLMRDNVELTIENRPEERVFEWLFEPMSIMKEQLKVLNLIETEELYLYKFSLYCGDTEKVEAWRNGGMPPQDGIRRAQLEGISRRLQGFCLTMSRLPTFRRRFHEVVKALMQEAKQRSDDIESGSNINPV